MEILSGSDDEIISAPKASEVEITLIGTGGGYGECIVVKLSENDWFVIDSCINPYSGEPLAIEYLESIKVDYTTAVKKVICTHWHDDHIRGLSKILELCPNANFCPTRVNDIKNFLLLIGIDEKINSKSGIRATKEFAKCIGIINERESKSVVIRLNANAAIYQDKTNDILFEMYALSPSETVVQKFDSKIGSLIKEVGTEKRAIVHINPNETSVAILIKLLDQRMILGSDLEIGSHPDEGWNDVVNNVVVIDEIKAQLYKVPHHGSENGYDLEIFQRLIEKNSILKMTPWNLGSKLPTDKMVNKYSIHSNKLFITSSNYKKKRPEPIKRDRFASKVISDFNKTLEEVKFSHGIIQSRFDFLNPNGWDVKIYGSAFAFE